MEKLTTAQLAGDIIVDDQCSGCNACLAGCPVAKKGGRSIQAIAGSRACISCGACLSACPAQAIDYQDDTEQFFQDLQKGVPISLLTAPAVPQHFPEYLQLFGLLRQLGVRSFHRVGLRADITLWAYVEVLRKNPHSGFIASPCAAVSRYIHQHMPLLRTQLMPVYSPLLCTAIYLKKYKGLKERLAFLSPCVAKRGEMRATAEPMVSYNITIAKLKNYLADHNISFASYAPVNYADAGIGRGKTLESYGGVSECIRPHIPHGHFIKIAGTDQAYPYLAAYAEQVKKGGKLPTLIEIYNCANGCNTGTGTGVIPDGNNRILTGELPAVIAKRSDEIARNAAAQILFRRFDRKLNLLDFISAEIDSSKINEVVRMQQILPIEDNGTVLDITYQNMVNYHGRSYIAGVAMAFKLLQRCLNSFAESNIASRDKFSILLGVNGPGIIDGLEMATRVKSQGRLRVDQQAVQDKDAPDAADGKGGKYYFEVTHGERKIILTLKHGLLPAEFIELAYQSHTGLLTDRDAQRLQQLKEEIAVFLMGTAAEDLFHVS
ncbi:[Fe-Fe] hydrogenase large subunit C-terminal domain-containing protein [Anaerospora sp.]|uniref:[Fe-Fe] hydrogenase large subunit C-terminal domain-containing protein n=1 Tax=Anaerospora sp. TaxID=1960278 RepID=UPI002899D345|nr:[Fe-Fe] hydrogenase large subunit C-terminal domain-containing protein [Anaerospora sp.]